MTPGPWFGFYTVGCLLDQASPWPTDYLQVAFHFLRLPDSMQYHDLLVYLERIPTALHSDRKTYYIFMSADYQSCHGKLVCTVNSITQSSEVVVYVSLQLICLQLQNRL